MSNKDPFLEREAQNYETPIPSREYILSVLTEMGVPVKRRTLLQYFALEAPDLKEALRRRLKAMLRDGQIFQSPEGYIPITHPDTCKGVVVIEKEGLGYLKTQDGQSVLLAGQTLQGYYDGDEVEVQIIQVDKEGYPRGRIIALLQGTIPLVIGRLLKAHQYNELLPFDKKFSQSIIIPEENKGQATEGDIIQAQIIRGQLHHGKEVAKVVDVLGDFSTPGIEINMAMRKFNLPQAWPKAVEKESKKFKLPVLDDNREDLTDLPLVTIDGEDAKDFDDAVYCEENSSGWQLWVAIADVSYYVQPNSALDKEALKRGNSTYFPGSVIPMLPEVLSNGLCSLKPDEPRLCVVCHMEIKKTGSIANFSFFRAIMHSKARLTYTEVNEILHGNKLLRTRFANLITPLEALHALYQALHKQRRRRGAIDFDTIETQILFDKDGKIKSIIPRIRNVAHKMIEESMLAANVCAAKFLQKNKVNTLYRIHDRPPQDKLKALREFLAELGLSLTHKQPTAKDFTRLIDQIQTRQDKHMIETVLLRSMSQAQYHPKNIGHFGLAYPCYVHFTSPIRRYPDLVVHRGIIAKLQTKRKKQEEINYEKLGLLCSQTERRSDEATRDAALALKCHFMQDKVGQTFDGIVSGVASFGLFVELKDIYIEGLVHVTSLGNEYFHYDSTHHRMIGQRTRTLFRLGDKLEVQVMRVDLETKRIDLELVKVESPKKAKTHKKKRKAPHKKEGKKKRKRKNNGS